MHLYRAAGSSVLYTAYSISSHYILYLIFRYYYEGSLTMVGYIVMILHANMTYYNSSARKAQSKNSLIFLEYLFLILRNQW